MATDNFLTAFQFCRRNLRRALRGIDKHDHAALAAALYAAIPPQKAIPMANWVGQEVIRPCRSPRRGCTGTLSVEQVGRMAALYPLHLVDATVQRQKDYGDKAIVSGHLPCTTWLDLATWYNVWRAEAATHPCCIVHTIHGARISDK